MADKKLKEFICEEARNLGFDKVGFATAAHVTQAEYLKRWLNQGYHASMQWMNNHLEKRIDPRMLFPGARSVIVVALNYHQPQARTVIENSGKISQYAWGEDYHEVLKDKLYMLLNKLCLHDTQIEGKVCVDTAPMMDKYWAVQAGIGWQGKHSNVISRELGSWFFIGSLIVNVDIEPDMPIADFCGSCTRCIDACPTQAIIHPYVVDSGRCISYYTIEHRREHLPESLVAHLQNWIYGCDVCQDVCPWNIKFEKPTREARFTPRMENINVSLQTWQNLTEHDFRLKFRKSAVKRTKFAGLLRNIYAALEPKAY